MNLILHAGTHPLTAWKHLRNYREGIACLHLQFWKNQEWNHSNNIVTLIENLKKAYEFSFLYSKGGKTIKKRNLQHAMAFKFPLEVYKHSPLERPATIGRRKFRHRNALSEINSEEDARLKILLNYIATEVQRCRAWIESLGQQDIHLANNKSNKHENSDKR